MVFMGTFTPIWYPEPFCGLISGFLTFLVKSGHYLKKAYFKDPY
jgi:hypothetical protein